MDNNALLAAAKQIQQPSEEAVQEYSEKKDALIIKMNEIMSTNKDITEIIGGADNIDMMVSNHKCHADFMTGIFVNYSPDVFVNIVLWVYKTYRAHGFQTTYWPLQLGTWLNIFEEELSESTFNEIKPFYTWILDNHETLVSMTNA